MTFAAGETTKTISVSVSGDTADEPDETFAVNLSAPVNATIADAQGIVTIVDNDPIPAVTIDDIQHRRKRFGHCRCKRDRTAVRRQWPGGDGVVCHD